MVLFNIRKKVLEAQLRLAGKIAKKKEKKIRKETAELKDLEAIKNRIKQAKKLKLTPDEKKVLKGKAVQKEKNIKLVKKLGKSGIVLGKKTLRLAQDLSDASADLLIDKPKRKPSKSSNKTSKNKRKFKKPKNKMVKRRVKKAARRKRK